jgi:hypothetical protein
MKKWFVRWTVITVLLLVVSAAANLSCGNAPAPDSEQLVGAWKGPVQFSDGMFAAINDFEFMRVYNAGGTMTESSNYDGVPPTPPAYGVWRKNTDGSYFARYQFYWNNMPASFEEMTENGGFSPGGYGVLTENITLSDDGNSYKARISAVLFDKSGTRIDSAQGDASAERITF